MKKMPEKTNIRSWKSLCDSSGLNVIAEFGFTAPTEIQGQIIPSITKGKSIIACAQTGSGKTIGYGLPLCLRLKQSDDRKNQVNAQPRAIILCPTRELASQVAGVIKRIGHSLKLSSSLSTGGRKINDERSHFQRPIDILTTTTGRLRKLLKFRAINLDRLETLVVDEMDTMFDDQGFYDDLCHFRFQLANPAVQKVLVGAVLTPKIRIQIKTLAGKLTCYETEGLHHLVKSAEQQFIQLKSSQKISTLFDVLEQSKSAKIMVFCNATERCREVEQRLNAAHFDSACLHGDLTTKRRNEEVERFLHSNHARVLVCTDIAARGIDLLQCEHVVNYDVPRTEIMYLHRVGRTARAEQKGLITTLVTNRDLALINALQRAHKLNINIVRARKDQQENRQR